MNNDSADWALERMNKYSGPQTEAEETSSARFLKISRTSVTLFLPTADCTFFIEKIFKILQ